MLSPQLLEQVTCAPLNIRLLDGSNTFPCLLSFFSGSSLSSHPLLPCLILMLVMVFRILVLFFILRVSLSPVLPPTFLSFPHRR